MPAALERKLKQEAKKKGIKDKDAYVYGTLRKTGWKPNREKKMNDPSESINFAGLGEELPAVGKSLERLRNIVKNPGHPGIRIDVARGRVGAVGPRTRTSGLSKYWSTPGEMKSYKMAKSAGYSGALAPDKPTAYLGRGGPIRGPLLYSASSKLIRLSEIDKTLDSIIQFQNDDRHPLKTAAMVGAGAGGVLSHQAIQRAGGYGANIATLRAGPDLLGQATGNVAQSVGSVGTKLAPAYKAGKSAVGAVGSVGGKIWDALKGAFKTLESKEKPIEFGSEILGPWQGTKGHTSKIDQLEFPTGLSPAAVLKFPFPKLMAYLNQRNILQQQFSWKHQRLIELRAKLDEINA